MPGAWDILRVRQQRLLIATPAPPDLKVSMGWAASIRELQVPLGSDFMKIVGLPIAGCRNRALVTALDGGYGGLFFLDADTVVPANCITELVASGRDVIAAQYFQRYPPFKSAHAVIATNEKGEQYRGDIPPHAPGAIVPVDFLATGATYYSRRALEALRANFRRPFEWGVDIAPVPGDNNVDLPPISEDYMASLRLKVLGFQPWLHTALMCKHEFMAVATEKGADMPGV